jgi:hypothetical protein
MRGDDGRAAQRQYLVERGVRRVADVDQHAQPVHLGNPALAEWGEALPAALSRGAVRELVVAAVDRPAIRTPRRWKVSSKDRSVPSGQLFSMLM